MNIDFNFGEHIHYNSSDILTGISISFLGAFFGFLFALWINRRIENKRRKEEEKKRIEVYKDRLRYLILYIDSVTQTAQEQHKKYLVFAGEMKKTPLKILVPKVLATSDFERLKNYSSNGLLEAYLYFDTDKEKNLENYKTMFALADFFFKKFGEYALEYKRYVSDIYEQQKFVQRRVEGFSIDIENKLKNLEKENSEHYKDSDEYKFLNLQAIRYNQIIQGELDLKKLKNEYLNPLNETIHDAELDIDFANKISKAVKFSISKIENIESNSVRYALILESQSDKNKINNCVQNLNKSRDLLTKLIEHNE